MATPIPLFPAGGKPNRFRRSVRALVEAHSRMYLIAAADPATSRINPVLQQRVLRMLAL